jgi:hypothetical protein
MQSRGVLYNLSSPCYQVMYKSVVAHALSEGLAPTEQIINRRHCTGE